MKHVQHTESIPLWNILLDVFIICIAVSATTMMQNHAKPFRRGFFCDDDTIRHPYKSSTVNDAKLYTCTVSIPVLTISAVELFLQQGERGERGSVLVGSKWAVPSWTARWTRHVMLFALGFGTQETLVTMGKLTVGRLRPHFLDVCKPNVWCNATGMDPHAYITDYECTGDEERAREARLSFPSGHSAMSFYAAVFTVMFLERRMRWPDHLVVYKTAFEVVVIGLAWFTALSRLPDFKHHWGDVLTGSALGIAVAWFFVQDGYDPWYTSVSYIGSWIRSVLYVRPDAEITNCTSEATFVFNGEASTPEGKV